MLSSLPSSTIHIRPDYSEKPIGVFDSGVGGLTVVAALRHLLPHEDIIYLGDTARVPYGGKSPETVTRYSKEIANLLFEEEAKLLVVACNTASALAVPALQELYAAPIEGVIIPGATAAVKATRTGTIGVIGTKATIASKAYEEAIHSLQPEAVVISRACPLLVPLVEEGLFEDTITQLVLARYLEPILAEGIDTLVLGCTHYPLLKKMITEVIGNEITLVDSAENCALTIKALLESTGLTRRLPQEGKLRIMLTDTSENFLHVAATSLNLPVDSIRIAPLH